MDTSLFGLLHTVYHMPHATRRNVAEQTGMSLTRASAAISLLIGAGLVQETSAAVGTPGRPAGTLAVNPDAGSVLGLDIGGHFSWAVLTDLSGRILHSLIRETRAVSDRAVILEDILGLIEAICTASGKRPDALLGIGLGMRGIVDARTGVTLGWPNTPAWSRAWTDWNLGRELRERSGQALIVLEDSVRAMGLNALRFGPAQGSNVYLYLFLGSGIGSGLFIGGRPYQGGIGLSGELGHVTLNEAGPWCFCGNRGCLEVYASTAAVLRRLRERLVESEAASELRQTIGEGNLSVHGLIEAARAGDKIGFQVLDETGEYVGRVLAIALNLLGPELVVLGGPLVRGDGVILEAVRRQVRLRALQQISSQVRIVNDDQGEFAGARGAALLALDAAFDSPVHVARLVSRELEPPLPA